MHTARRPANHTTITLQPSNQAATSIQKRLCPRPPHQVVQEEVEERQLLQLGQACNHCQALRERQASGQQRRQTGSQQAPWAAQTAACSTLSKAQR